eukprot:18545-Heterococcus_DN1.PRE.2
MRMSYGNVRLPTSPCAHSCCLASTMLSHAVNCAYKLQDLMIMQHCTLYHDLVTRAVTWQLGRSCTTLSRTLGRSKPGAAQQACSYYMECLHPLRGTTYADSKS